MPGRCAAIQTVLYGSEPLAKMTNKRHFVPSAFAISMVLRPAPKESTEALQLTVSSNQNDRLESGAKKAIYVST